MDKTADVMGTLRVVVMGPKAVGKSWVAQVLSSRLGIYHVETDALILELMELGHEPDADIGWLASVEGLVVTALEQHPAVSVEATGAWDSDWLLIDRLRDRDITVCTVWVNATLHQSLVRLHERTARKVPTSESEAIWQ